jgi:hypothetical protein
MEYKKEAGSHESYLIKQIEHDKSERPGDARVNMVVEPVNQLVPDLVECSTE